jgi:hypothetical protein
MRNYIRLTEPVPHPYKKRKTHLFLLLLFHCLSSNSTHPNGSLTQFVDVVCAALLTICFFVFISFPS